MIKLQDLEDFKFKIRIWVKDSDLKFLVDDLRFRILDSMIKGFRV